MAEDLDTLADSLQNLPKPRALTEEETTALIFFDHEVNLFSRWAQTNDYPHLARITGCLDCVVVLDGMRRNNLLSWRFATAALSFIAGYQSEGLWPKTLDRAMTMFETSQVYKLIDQAPGQEASGARTFLKALGDVLQCEHINPELKIRAAFDDLCYKFVCEEIARTDTTTGLNEATETSHGTVQEGG